MDLISDLELICSIDESDYKKIIAIYSDSKNKALDRTLKLKKLTSSGNSDAIKALLRLISFITDTATDARKYADNFVDLSDTIKRFSESNPDAAKGWDKLQSSIPQLGEFFLNKKIDKIKDKYSRITSFQITTDIRPIFDLDKREIETNIYPFILKIETSDEKSFLCEFYEDTLDELIEELELAKSKAKTIQEKLKKYSINNELINNDIPTNNLKN